MLKNMIEMIHPLLCCSIYAEIYPNPAVVLIPAVVPIPVVVPITVVVPRSARAQKTGVFWRFSESVRIVNIQILTKQTN